MICNSVVYSVIVYLLVEVHSQVCTRQIIGSKMEPYTYRKSYLVTYRGPCDNGRHYKSNCSLSRWETKIEKGFHLNTMAKRIMKFCCDGYARVDNTYNDSDIKCKPICEPPCENGYCIAPNVCQHCCSGEILVNGTCKAVSSENLPSTKRDTNKIYSNQNNDIIVEVVDSSHTNATNEGSIEKSWLHHGISILITVLLPKCWNQNATCATDNCN